MSTLNENRINEIELDRLSDSDEIYSRIGEPQAHNDRKYVDWWIRTYITRNYMTIIKVLVSILCIALIIIGILTYFTFKTDLNPINEPENSTVLPVIRGVTAQEDTHTTTRIIDSSIPSTRGLVCKKINCLEDRPCLPDRLGYHIARKMACCGCFPDGYKMIRFEEDQNERMTIIFDVSFNLSNYSRYDVALLPKIENLDGNWELIIESDIIYRLAYKNIEINHSHSGELEKVENN